MKPSQRVTPLFRRLLASLLALLHLLVFVPGAHGAPILDPHAPIASTPRLETTPRGVPILHIAPPDAGGLSHNRLQRLDIDALGLIFNNSTTGGTTLNRTGFRGGLLA